MRSYSKNVYLRIMNKRQKAQLIIGILSAILFIVWIVLPGNLITRLLGMLSNALVMLSMYLSYRAEEKKKTKSDTPPDHTIHS